MPLRQTRLYRKQVYKTGTIFSIGPTAARYLILLLLGVFSLLFLVQSTQGAQVSVDIRNEDSKQADQRQELSTLEINATRIQSLPNLNQAAAANGLVPIGNPETLTATPNK